MSDQTDYGGRVHKLSCVQETIEVERDKVEFSTTVNSYEDELKIYYILNLKDKAQLKMDLGGLRRYSYNIITLLCGRLGGN